MTTIDLDMCAVDLADTLGKHGYADVSGDAIRPLLEAFLVEAAANQARLDQEAAATGPDAATWAPSIAEDTDPIPQRGRRPRATYWRWGRDQLVNIGATSHGAWYWQCPTTGCKAWAGPYPDTIAAKEAGFAHVYRCDKTNYFR